MVRLLLTVFFVGLVVSCACWAAVAAMGGPDHGWGPRFTRYDDGHWAWRSGDDVGVKGERSAAVGQTATREIAWNGSNRLEIDIPADIDYTQGPNAKVTATGPQNLIDQLTIVDGVIDYESKWAWKRRNQGGIHLTIQAPAVNRFELDGAGKINIDAYQQDSMNLEVNGAAKISAQGRTKQLRVELNGASSADMGSLQTDEASAELNGASSVTMDPRTSARVEINGVGHAHLLTHPAKMEQEINGLGSVTYGSDAPSPPAKPAAAPKAGARSAPI